MNKQNYNNDFFDFNDEEEICEYEDDEIIINGKKYPSVSIFEKINKKIKPTD